jgi:hypothetical protein
MSWMQGFGWKKKVGRLRMTILTAGHQGAKELPAGLLKVLSFYRQSVKVLDDPTMMDDPMIQEEFGRFSIAEALAPNVQLFPWESIESHGWEIRAAMYLQNDQLWWLLHAQRRTEHRPCKKDVAFLNKVLDYLGADPKRDMIISPTSGPADGPGLLPFGWWTWFNRMTLFEIQVCKDKKSPKEMIRIVPLGTAESDGYVRLDSPELS